MAKTTAAILPTHAGEVTKLRRSAFREAPGSVGAGCHVLHVLGFLISVPCSILGAFTRTKRGH